MKHYRHCHVVMHCDPPNVECYFGSCNQCPGVDSLTSLLQAVMDENAIDTVKFKQWTMTDHASLATRVLQVDEFIDTFTTLLKKLLVHDFVAKIMLRLCMRKGRA